MSEFSVNIHLFNVNNQRVRPQKGIQIFSGIKKRASSAKAKEAPMD